MKKALMLASVASMIDQFNMENITVLQKMGYQVDVACNFQSGSTTSKERVNCFKQELIESGIGVYDIPFPREISDIKHMGISYKKMKDILNETHYNIVHCHSPIGGAIARMAGRSTRKKGTFIIYTAHGFHFYKGASKKNWLIFYPIEKYIARFTDCLITINIEDYQFAKYKKFPARQIEYIPGIGIDTKLINENSVDIKKKKRELKINEECVLLSVGEINNNKNHEIIIRAISKIKLPFKYIICGKGTKKSYLEFLVKELKVEDKVIFTGYRSDVYDLMGISNIFCFPSYREGLSVALMEAMATGLAVVGSEIRGNMDLIENHAGGYLIRPKDIHGYKIAIEKLIKDENLRDNMGLHNKETIKKFDSEKVMEKMKNIYREGSLADGSN